MGALSLFVIALAVVVVAYPTWGTRVSRHLGIDDGRPTPATTHADGVDYVASPPAMQ